MDARSEMASLYEVGIGALVTSSVTIPEALSTMMAGGEGRRCLL